MKREGKGEGEGERERELIFHLLIHSPDDCNGAGQAEARSQDLHPDGRQGTE